MSEEEKKAIEILKEITTDDLLNCWEGGEEEYNAIQTVLNLIQSQQKEIEKKDEIIDLMSYVIIHEDIPQEEYCILRDMNCEIVGGNRECKNCIKQYFEKKAEEDK